MMTKPHLRLRLDGALEVWSDLREAWLPCGRFECGKIRLMRYALRSWGGTPRRAIGLDKLPQKPTPEETMAVFSKAKSLGVPAHSLPEYQELERRMDSANDSAWDALGIAPPNVPMRPEEITGQMFHQGLGQKRIGPQELGGANYPEASDYLLSKGVPGIKYLDQGSRASGDGSRNYVAFDDKLVDILKRYGLLGGLMGGAGMMAAQPGQDQTPDMAF